MSGATGAPMSRQPNARKAPARSRAAAAPAVATHQDPMQAELEDIRYALQRHDDKKLLQDRLLRQIERARAEPVEYEFQNSPDGLINLMMKQYVPDGVSTFNRYTRISEIFKKLNEDGLMSIDINNKLHRECVCAILTTIYAPFETFLKETFGEFSRNREVLFYMQRMWERLHFYLLEHGFDIQNVMRFIKMYNSDYDIIDNVQKPEAYKSSNSSVLEGTQFGSHRTSHRNLYEEFRRLLPQLEPLPPHLQFPN